MQRRSPYPKILFLAPLLFITLLLSAQSPADYIHTAPRRVPFPLNLSAGATSRYLCKGAASDEEKAWRLYAWEARHIRYDVRSAQNARQQIPGPFMVLLRRRARCDGYSELYMALCKAAGLQAIRITGYSKDIYFDPGDRFYKADHAWNGVKLSGKWYLIDVTWGAGYVEHKKMPIRKFIRKCFHLPTVNHKLRFVRSFSPNWFCANPDFFRVNHDPVNPLWQLLEEEKDLHSFEGLKPGTDTVQPPKIPTGVQGMENENADNFVQSNRLNQMTLDAANGYEHNLRNNKLIADKELFIADTFFNAANNTRKPDIERILAFQKAIDQCNFAITYYGCQRNDIHEEYKFLHEKNSDKQKLAHHEIKEVLDTNNRRIRYIVKLININNARLSKIRNQLGNDGVNAKIIRQRNIEKVKTGKSSHFNDSLIALNKDSIRLNHRRIDSLQKNISGLERRQEELRMLYAGTNQQLLSDLISGRASVIKAIELREDMNDSYKPELRELTNDLSDIKKQEKADFRKNIEDAANGSILLGLEIEKEIKMIRSRYVQNEKFIKQNKRLGQKDEDAGAAFREENRMLLETISQMKSVLIKQRELIKEENNSLRLDLKYYNKQDGSLNEELLVENERRRQEDKRLDKYMKAELRINARRMKHANAVKMQSLKEKKRLEQNMLKQGKMSTD